jgi:hypothetical protein
MHAAGVSALSFAITLTPDPESVEITVRSALRSSVTVPDSRSAVLAARRLLSEALNWYANASTSSVPTYMQ